MACQGKIPIQIPIPLKNTDTEPIPIPIPMYRYMINLIQYIRGSLKVVEASKKIQEGRLRWYGHLLRRDENHVGRYAMDMEVQGRRRRGKPRKRWRDCVREDLQWKDIDEAEALNRNRWRQLIRNGDPI